LARKYPKAKSHKIYENMSNSAQIANCERNRNQKNFFGEFAPQSQMILRLAIAAQTQSVFKKKLHPCLGYNSSFYSGLTRGQFIENKNLLQKSTNLTFCVNQSKS
jgi:hypothetical protein